MSGLAPNLGAPIEVTDPFGNTTVSPHTPTTQFTDNTGNQLPVRDPSITTGYDSYTNTQEFPSVTNPSNTDPLTSTGGGGVANTSGGFDIMQFIEDAREQAAASGVELEAANEIRNQQLIDAYGGAQESMQPFMGMGDAYGQAQNMLSGGMTPESMGLYRDAVGTPQSGYFDQAAALISNRPSRLEDIEGYDLMKQARDEALRASNQGFAGMGKSFSGSRFNEAADIGGRAAQNLIAQDDMRRQQQFSNLMGMGQQDVSLQQAGLGNYRNLMMDENALNQQQFGNLMGVGNVGYNTAQNMANMQMGLGQQLGGNTYGTQQDVANLMAGGTAQQNSLAGLQLQQQLNQQQVDSQNLAGWLGALGMLGGAVLCDARAKENTKLVGQYKGVNMYEFNYIGDDTVRLGPIAQEMLESHPDLVSKTDDGYLFVDLRGL